MENVFRQPVLWAFCIGIEVNDMKQPEAIRLADALITPYTECNSEAAAELRRLHAANMDCMAWYESIKADYEAMRKAVVKLHAAKGRYHTQLAACDLYDLLGLKNERSTK